MKLRSIVKSKEFIPTFNGNDELPADEKIVINITRFPTNAEAAKYKTYKFDGSGSLELVFRDEIMLPAHVGKIKNLSDDEGPIDSGAALSRSTNLLLDGLIAEIRQYLLDSEELEPGE